MIKQNTLTLAAIAALSLCCVDAAFARKHAPAAEKAAPAAEQAPAQPTGKLVDYAELEHKIGSEIIVETTLHTVRRGTLLKYTNPAITVQLGPDNGSMELTIPRETVRNVSVVLAPAQAPAAEQPAPQAQTTGTGSAKKN